MTSRRGPLGDGRRRRGRELPPTPSVLIGDAVVGLSAAAAVGCGLLLCTLPLLALLGRLVFPDSPTDFIEVFGGPLLAAVLGGALSLITWGYASTTRQLALVRMYARTADPRELRNAVEVRGPIGRSPRIAAVATTTSIGVIALGTGGILLAAGALPLIAAVSLVVGALCIPVVLVLLAADRRWARVAADRLPTAALGEQGPARVLVADDDVQKRVDARERRERSALDRAATPLLMVLTPAALACAVLSLRPPTGVSAQAQVVGAAVGPLSVLALLVLGALRIDQLRRVLQRVRAGRGATAADRGRASAATTVLAADLRTATAVWVLLGAGVLGLTAPDLTPAVVTAIILLLGLAALFSLAMRLGAAAPSLREKFGYRLPVEHPSDGGGNLVS